MASEVFNISTQLSAAQEDISRLKGIVRNKEDLLKAKEEELRSKIEKMGRSERKNSKQHVIYSYTHCIPQRAADTFHTQMYSLHTLPYFTLVVVLSAIHQCSYMMSRYYFHIVCVCYTDG